MEKAIVTDAGAIFAKCQPVREHFGLSPRSYRTYIGPACSMLSMQMYTSINCGANLLTEGDKV